MLVGAQAGAKLPPADVSETTISVDSKPIKLTIVRPAGAKGVLPAFMLFHGGGWILGDFPTHERFVRDLVADSVGGNMAAVAALMARAKGAPALRAQVLFWPVTNANFENASYDGFENDHFLTRNTMKWFWDAYTAEPKQRQEICASPLPATVEQLAGLPPTLVQSAEVDVLRDEGDAYARKLHAAGVTVVATRYDGMIRDFGLLNVLSGVPSTRAALHQAGDEPRSRLR